MSGFEGAARAEKALALIAAIDVLNESPRVDSRALVNVLREQDAGWWSEVARIAQVPEPSEETREKVSGTSIGALRTPTRSDRQSLGACRLIARVAGNAVRPEPLLVDLHTRTALGTDSGPWRDGHCGRSAVLDPAALRSPPRMSGHWAYPRSV